MAAFDEEAGANGVKIGETSLLAIADAEGYTVAIAEEVLPGSYRFHVAGDDGDAFAQLCERLGLCPISASTLKLRNGS